MPGKRKSTNTPIPVPEKQEIKFVMQEDSSAAWDESAILVSGCSKEDIEKIHDQYGPYASTLIKTAVLAPNKFNTGILNVLPPVSNNLSPWNILNIDPIKNSSEAIRDLIADKPLDYETIGKVLNKTPVEIEQGITEYKEEQARLAQINDTYKTVCNGEEAKSTSIESLLAAGVTMEDFQAVFEKDETLAFNMGNSASTNAIVNAAKNINNGRATGYCGAGTQEVTDSIRGNPTSRALHSNTPQYALDQGIPSDGASGYYARLEQSGNYIVLTKPNEACVDTTNVRNDKKRDYIINNRNSAANKAAIERMCDFTDQLPRGTIITWDNHTSTDSKGNITPIEGGNGITYGHVAYKITNPDDKDQAYKCDGVQKNPHTAGWYGKNIHMCYNIDSEVPAEYAKKLIEQAQERTGQCLDVEENRKNYEASHAIAQNKKIAEQKAQAAVNNNRFSRRVQTRSSSRRRTSKRRTQAIRTTGRSGGR